MQDNVPGDMVIRKMKNIHPDLNEFEICYRR